MANPYVDRTGRGENASSGPSIVVLADLSREAIMMDLVMPADLLSRDHFVAERVDKSSLHFEFGDFWGHEPQPGEFNSLVCVVRPTDDSEILGRRYQR